MRAGSGPRAAAVRRRQRRRRRRMPSSSSSACRRRRAPTARPTSPSSRPRPPHLGPAARARAVVINKSTVPVGSTRRGRARARPRRRVRRVEPGVPPRGLGGARLPQPRSDRHRRRRPRPPPSGWRRSTTASTHRVLVTDPASAETDQVRVQRLPRHQDQLHQRHRQPVRGRGRRRQRGRARHGLRQAHRFRVPATRPGLGRYLLPEGHEGAGPDRARTPATTSVCSKASSTSTSSSTTG